MIRIAAFPRKRADAAFSDAVVLRTKTPMNAKAGATSVALAGAALLATTFTVAACSATVDSEPEDAGVSSGPWTCDRTSGPVRRTSSRQPLQCEAGRVCTIYDGDQWSCCLLTDSQCGGDGSDNAPNFYCFPSGGLVRYNTTAHYPVCKADEICALHDTADCNYTCCSLADDPDCGISKDGKCGLE
jgi:hypothetical protein